MKKPHAFRLEPALAAWRHALQHDRFIRSEDLDELEQHVRDQVAHLMAQGHSEASAFQRAMEAMGAREETRAAYRKVYWGKLHHERRRTDELMWGVSMLKNYVTITLRNATRYKGTFLINLIGLSTGLACVLLIFLWVNDELSVDTFHEKDHRLYHVMQHYETSQGTLTWESTPALLAEALAEELPDVESAAHANSSVFRPEGILSSGENDLPASGLFASENYFEVFSYDLIEGDRTSVLAHKDDVVLSEDVALKLFRSTEGIVGKTVEWKNQWMEGTFQVSGVFEDPPSNATAQFDAVVRYDWLVDADPNAGAWTGDYAETYVVLNEGVAVDRFNETIADYLKARHASRERSTLFVQRYSAKYLYGRYEDGVQAGGRITYVRLFSMIALFILVMACINFMNLATARASRKMKEIGVRKAVGARREALIVQFLGESMFMALLSLGVAMLLVVILLPSFNVLTGKHLQLNMDLRAVFSAVGIVLFTGLIAGSYPAFYLSGFNPAAVLKGLRTTSVGELWIRKGLVIFQFSLSILFMVGVFVVNKQLEYTRTKHLGYDRDHIITFQGPSNNDDPAVFLSELKKIPGVERASNMVWSVLNGRDAQSGYSWRGQESDRERIFKSPRIGYGVIETLGMEMRAGRSFSRDYQDDPSKIIINETALRVMQLDDPIGKTIRYGEGEQQIIGVVGDFHYGSLHHTVEPLIFRLREDGRDMLVKLRPGAEKATIEQIERLYNTFYPEYPFEFSFLDDEYQALYQAESRVAALTKCFTVLALVISCLGLFGLASFTAERRSKEIGIRKVLGASVLQIVRLLSADFTRMVVAAILIALPISYLLARNWLDGFAYKVDLQGWFFVVAAGMTLLIAWLTVGVQTLKAATVNPVDCLQNE